ncbi:MAG: hypothetical protein KJZ77_01545 [Anaerolineales bacterium]|jgi:Ca2+-binding RTX toxin-like protein|nr:hypothetical protein [Anaerolineales bacterium]
MRRRFKLPLRHLIVGLVALLVLSSMTAIAATNTVPPTRVDNVAVSFNLNHIKPSACAGISVTNLITGSGTITGTEGNDLIFGSAGADEIYGLGGNDCIVGGGGDDMLDGGNGNDVCIGGAGDDVFENCEGEVQ